MERELAAQGESLTIAHEVSTSAAAYRMVSHNMGFTFAEPFSVPPEMLQQFRLIPWEPATSLEVGFFHPKGPRKHTNRERFIAELEQVCRERAEARSQLEGSVR